MIWRYRHANDHLLLGHADTADMSTLAVNGIKANGMATATAKNAQEPLLRPIANRHKRACYTRRMF